MKEGREEVHVGHSEILVKFHFLNLLFISVLGWFFTLLMTQVMMRFIKIRNLISQGCEYDFLVDCNFSQFSHILC